MSRKQLVSLCVGTLLSLPLAAQVQPDWRSTYESPVPPAGCRGQVTALAIAPSGDIFWASDHAWHNTTTQAWQQRTELHATSATGVPLWTISPAPNADVIYFQALVDAAGNVYFSGQAGRPNDYPDLLVTKVSPGGAVLWSKRINGPLNDYDVGIGSLDATGRFSFVGTLDMFQTVLVETYDAAGNVAVSSTFPAFPAGIGWINDLAPLPGGGFALCGSHPLDGAFVARIDAAGALLWSDALTLAPNVSGLSLHSLSVDANSRIAVAGSESYSNLTGSSLYRVYDASGQILHQTNGPALDVAFQQRCAFAPDGTLWLTSLEQSSAISPLELRAHHLAADLTPLATFATPTPSPQSFVRRIQPGSAGQLFFLMGTGELGEISWDGQLDWLVPLSSPANFDWFTGFEFDSNHGLVAFGIHDNSNGASTDPDTLLARFDAHGIPSNFGTGMVGALGCRPQLHHSGRASANGTGSFELTAFPWRNQVAGRFLVGTGAAIANPFFSGTIHVGVPRVRTPATSSGGSATGVDDCSGVLTLDFDAWASGSLGGTLLPGLQTVGTTVRAQAWSRDPGAPGNTLLSDALEFTLLP